MAEASAEVADFLGAEAAVVADSVALAAAALAAVAPEEAGEKCSFQLSAFSFSRRVRDWRDKLTAEG